MYLDSAITKILVVQDRGKHIKQVSSGDCNEGHGGEVSTEVSGKHNKKNLRNFREG